MKEFTSKIKKFFVQEQKINKKRGTTGNPYKDWAILFTASALILIGLFSFNAYLFYSIKNGTLFGSAEILKSSVKKYDHEGLDKLIRNQFEKEKTFEEIKENLVEIVDPSR